MKTLFSAHWIRGLFFCFCVFLLTGMVSLAEAREPQTVNPFGQRPDQDSDEREVYPGYVEMSDGEIFPGFLYLTRDARLSMYDKEHQRKRQIPLARVASLEAVIKEERMEKEWRFKELASNEKMYTGREYPMRQVDYKCTFTDDRTLTAPLACLFFFQPLEKGDDASTGYKPEVDPIRFPLFDRQGKADTHNGMTLKEMVYVKAIYFGEEALEKGIKKAAANKKSGKDKKKTK